MVGTTMTSFIPIHCNAYLLKAADLVISLPIAHPAWPEEMYEPLTLAFVFPFLKYRPWQLKGSEGLLSLGRELLCMWKENLWTNRHLLETLELQENTSWFAASAGIQNVTRRWK